MSPDADLRPRERIANFRDLRRASVGKPAGSRLIETGTDMSGMADEEALVFDKRTAGYRGGADA